MVVKFGKAFRVYGKGSDHLVVFSLQRDDFDEEDDQEENSDIPFIQNEDGEIFNSNVIQLDTDAGTGLPIDDEINDDSTDDIEEEINTENLMIFSMKSE